MMRLLVLVAGLLAAVRCEDWPCDRQEAIRALRQKQQVNQWPTFQTDPYYNQTAASNEVIRQTLDNRVQVCAIKYTSDTKQSYELLDFVSAEAATQAGFTVTHQGKCGACSTLQDLSIYLGVTDLTTPFTKCALKGLFNFKWAQKCVEKIGFTSPCAQIWLYNSLHTGKVCRWVCLWSKIRRQPNNNPDGSLNKCLQCDEDKSGPVFKYFSGRTRRNSGITSAIDRPGEQVYEMNHCYY